MKTLLAGLVAGNRIPGTARSMSALEVAWQPAHGWRGGVELRRSGAVPVTTPPSYTTVAVHGGYVFNARGWDLAAMARLANVFDRRYAGSVIVNEGNSRFFEPAPGRGWVLEVAGSYAF